MELYSNEGPETGGKDFEDSIGSIFDSLDALAGFEILPTSTVACDADFFFGDLLNDFESDVDMDTFAELCKHIKNTYQALHSANTREDYCIALQPYGTLCRLAGASPSGIDTAHDVILYLVESTLKCIKYFSAEWPQPDKIMDLLDRDNVCYDFEKDTPQEVYDRIEAVL